MAKRMTKAELAAKLREIADLASGDPETAHSLADKLLLVAVFLMSTWMGLLPWWLAAAVVARDVMIGLGALLFRVFFGPLHGRPTLLSKINTGLQLSVVLAGLLHAAARLPPVEVVDLLVIATFIATVLSGFDYMQAFARRALLPSG